MNRYAFFKSKKKFYSEKCRLERTAGPHFWPVMVHIFLSRGLEAPIHTQRGLGSDKFAVGLPGELLSAFGVTACSKASL